MPPVPSHAPAGFVPLSAVATTLADGSAQPVGSTAPLPVVQVPPAAPVALAGVASGSAVAGPFAPQPGRPVILSLAGAWTGQVRVTRSTDGGTTRLGLTAGGAPFGTFTANACEAVWEESEAGATLHIEFTLSSGSATYRMGQ